MSSADRDGLRVLSLGGAIADTIIDSSIPATKVSGLEVSDLHMTKSSGNILASIGPTLSSTGNNCCSNFNRQPS